MPPSFAEKKKFVIDSGMTLDEMREILFEIEDDMFVTQSKLYDYVFVQQKIRMEAIS